ncbi:hypothetical protein F3J37_01470 [Pantoea sp. Al-1710]|uniref:Uncharacterized protein n=1 Tax=Candidatus Pantoea communis TaxID=2608354 RepID=A0ABX0RI76_9GAMM|nr:MULTISPECIES: hypothetical protein [Pantoea]NIG12952.1 hypothetical protein [Pantoea sp. Cy-640]NIG17347.1 hypothetical protein [Pantoea communis]
MIDEIDWLNWWRSGFVTDIHESWESLPWFDLSEREQMRLYQDSPSAVRALCQIPVAKVIAPDTRTLKYIDLSPVREKAMLKLVSSLCNHQYTHLSIQDQRWCERIIKGIRPETFLPTGIDYRRPAYLYSLTQKMFVDPVWQRLRLRFNREEVLECEERGLIISAGSLNRARALFDAALWRMERK